MSDDDMYFGEQGPTKLEYHVTGVCGMLVFILVLVLAFRGFLITSQSHRHLRFFFLGIFTTAACELPRYFIFTIQGTYTSRVGYSLHMLAGLFYFFSLSIVCYMWSCIVNLGPLSSWLYSKPGLIAANIFLGSILVFACIACLTSDSLSGFFHSDLFILFVAQEIVQSLLYTAGLALYGVSMIYKLQDGDRDRNGAVTGAGTGAGARTGTGVGPSTPLSVSTTSTASATAAATATGSALSVLQRLLVRITLTLGFTSLATLLRLVMCCLQIASAKSDFSVSNSFFSHYGILWFSLAEFIPRGGSSLALLLFMSKRSHQGSRREIRQRYAGSEGGAGGTIQSISSSARNISSGMEHSSMSSVTGNLLDNERDSMLFSSLKNSSSQHDPLKQDLLSTYSYNHNDSTAMDVA